MRPEANSGNQTPTAARQDAPPRSYVHRRRGGEETVVIRGLRHGIQWLILVAVRHHEMCDVAVTGHGLEYRCSHWDLLLGAVGTTDVREQFLESVAHGPADALRVVVICRAVRTGYHDGRNVQGNKSTANDTGTMISS